MSEQNRHITLKVILGYVLLILIMGSSIYYIYTATEEMASGRGLDEKSREKVYLVTNTLSQLYESDALGQLMGMPQEDVDRFNEIMNRAHRNMKKLRKLIDNPDQKIHIDEIDDLLEEKHQNTMLLLDTWNEASKHQLLDRGSGQISATEIHKGNLKASTDSLRQKQILTNQLLEKASSLRYSSSVITSKVNQMLRDIEYEEMNTSIEQVESRQKVVHDASFVIAGIAILALVIVVIFIILITRDISKSQYYRMKSEKARLYAEYLLRRREKLMLTISHDIRAPLSSIIGYIDLLLRRHPDERQRYYLENMKGSSDHILMLVNDLLDYHRLESGQMEIHNVPFSISALFNEIYMSFKPLAAGKGLDFIMNVGKEGTDKIWLGDPIRIRQVTGNLISNAIKFTNQGHIVLEVKMPDDSSNLSIIVSDSGSGIAETEQEKIFGEFTRLSGAEKEEGFGLGLSITRKLIQLMNGTISLQSKLGEGSTFTIILPLKLSDVQTLPSSDDKSEKIPEVEATQERDVYCLIVDDDPFQLALTEELLRKSHVEVTTCTDPFSVISLIKNTAFDVIVTDIQMPGMDGFKLLDKIRSSGIQGADKIPIIALSASVEQEHNHYLAAGFTGFINKPFTARQLIEELNELLQTNIKPAEELNFASLTAFAGEDKEASASILRTFTEETHKSILLFKKALDDKNRKQVARLSHKSIPIFSMLGDGRLVGQLRVLENEAPDLNDEDWKKLLDTCIERINTILEQSKMAMNGNQ